MFNRVPIVLLLAAAACSGPATAPPTEFEVAEATILELQGAMQEGQVTSAELVDLHLARIRAYDRDGPALNAIVRMNPLAREQAEALDAERAAGTVRGPLHGIPVLMKDNYDMDWMPTTGSSLALAGLRPGGQRVPGGAAAGGGCRHSGQDEPARTRGGGSPRSARWEGRRATPTTRRATPAAARAAREPPWPRASRRWGGGATPADRSAFRRRCTTSFGLRPTKGLSSIDGILPLSHSQDTGGPLARTATDLAIALDATVGPDPADPATAILEGRPMPSFQAALDPAALEGARIGVLEAWVEEEGAAAGVTRVIRAALVEMEGLGATVVDAEIPDMDELLANTGLIDFEFKFDLMDYLAGVPDAPVASLEDILEAGLHHEALDRNFRRRNERAARESPELTETMARRSALAAAVVDLLDREDLDALAYPTMRHETALIGAAPTGATCFLSAHTGLPALTVPAGFTTGGLPVGLELLGPALDDHRLVAFAFAHEAAHPKRRAPLRTPALLNGAAPAPVRIATDPPSGDGLEAALALDLANGALSYRIVVPDLGRRRRVRRGAAAHPGRGRGRPRSSSSASRGPA